ncbi:uncharacterized protein PFL1_06085 [Pseudozyma flocculosa PF-1]|uniref:Related to PUF3 - transcript-specific regulator of mRNA degradation n=2 Tax=Pseudozyma flocculosa TaxID=84751 RepID=A0A5C3F6A5_9BASI|nr:uncharacterized protein PFL1_06085 [Pseudozyma flocculosa PF-1]EPQ26437.1 hypothetical protein PFL1_06085 [Pseudozyma flocculosa PF-1]SPO38969.1 related to PUF3 - transcript-specific regulator of mRNA degradation [Pseudozyma flocculosa]
MAPHEASKAGPFGKHASVANLNGLAQLSRSTSSNSVPSARPVPQRSVSGSVEPSQQHLNGFTAIASPLATPSELVQEDPVAALHPSSNSGNSKLAMTGSPTVFGAGSLPHNTGGWSDSSTYQTASGASSVWNGRSGLASGSLDGDALATANTSEVTTPGRATTMGPGDLPSSSFSRSPLAAGDGTGGTWSSVAGSGPSNHGWPKDVPTASTADFHTSPTAAKQRLSPSEDRRRQQTVVRTVSPRASGNVLPDPGNAQSTATTTSHDRGSGPSGAIAAQGNARTVRPGGPGGGRAVPKNPPIRSTTLDPSHHLPGQRRQSGIDDASQDDPRSGDAELSDELRNMSISRNDTAPATDLPSHLGQAVLSPASTDVPLQPTMPNQPLMMPQQPHGPYQPTPQFGHAARLSSASYGSLSPVPAHVEGFSPSMPYYANNANRSPDAYGGFAGLGQLMPAMPGMGAGNGGPVIDMSGYESYRTTPDPYAPPVPGRQIFMSPSGPPSQGSTPQSPSFGPSPMPPMGPGPMRPSDAVFYPGPAGPYGVPGMASGSMSPVSRNGMQMPGTPQFGYASPTGPRNIPQSPSLGGSVGIGLSSMPIPHPGTPVFPPQSPLLPSQLGGPAGMDKRTPPQAQPAQHFGPGPFRRSISSADGYGGPQMMPAHPPPPYAMPGAQQQQLHQHQGQPYPGPINGPPGAAMQAGPAMGWNGRFPDHRRIPTGPGGVMAPPMGFGGGPMHPQHGLGGAAGMGVGVGGFVRPPGVFPHHGRGGPHGPGSQGSSNRSPLLEEFRSRHSKNRKFELRDIFGSVVEFSGDQHGSRFIQEKLDSASDEERTKVFDELILSARQLMTDVFGNYVIQKMIEHGTEAQRTALAKEMEGHVLALSLGTYGCRVVQKAFDHADEEQRIRLACELDGHVLQCVKDQNANHVVQKVIERVDPLKIDFVPQAFRGQVLVLAAHSYSCRVLQRIFEHCREEQSRPLLDELHAEAFRLMQDQYGNYVIQWVLQKGRPADQAQMIAKIKGQVLPLSRHKFASNVIEEVIRSASADDKAELIEEILTPRPVSEGAGPTPVPLPTVDAASNNASPGSAAAAAAAAGPQRIAPAVIMMKDQFANYVLQRFLENAKGEQKARLVAAIRPQLLNIKRFSNGYAKHLAAIERLLDEAEAASAAGDGASPGPTPAPKTSSSVADAPVAA